jgi:hypothetical protein
MASPVRQFARNGVVTLDISIGHAEAAAARPPIHHDPFDRLLIAPAGLRDLVLITAEATITRYDVALFPARWRRQARPSVSLAHGMAFPDRSSQ